MKRSLALLVVLAGTVHASSARADDATRSAGWGTVTTITTVTAMASQVLMPRVFYADPETTVGWKARWHVSALAPTMTLTALTVLNEYALKHAIASYRPGCGDDPSLCHEYQSLSSHSFAAFSALGNGTAVFLVDTFKYSDGRVNAGSLVGDVVLPFGLGLVTSIGRAAGNWESGGTVVVSSLVGLGFGALTGLTYSLMARPQCGYTGSLVCW